MPEEPIRHATPATHLKSFCPIEHIMVQQHQSRHSLNYRHGTGNHTRVVTPTCKKHCLLTVPCNCRLFLQQCRHWLERYTEIDIVAIGYSALYSAAVVGTCGYAITVIIKNIILLRIISLNISSTEICFAFSFSMGMLSALEHHLQAKLQP
mgnify:CR=1 FL=1